MKYHRPNGGSVHISAWDRGRRWQCILEYDAVNAEQINEAIQVAVADASANADSTPGLWMASCVIEFSRPPSALAALNAAALAQYMGGWTYYSIQETQDGHTFVSEVPAKNREEFIKIIKRGVHILPSSV